MREIHSKDNRIFKECQKLSQKKYRDREGLYLIEGENLIAEVPKKDLVYTICSDRQQWNLEDEKDVYLMADHLFSKIAQTETSQGILAVVQSHRFL